MSEQRALALLHSFRHFWVLSVVHLSLSLEIQDPVPRVSQERLAMIQRLLLLCSDCPSDHFLTLDFLILNPRDIIDHLETAIWRARRKALGSTLLG